MSALRKSVLGLSVAVVLAAWGVVVRTFAVDGGGEYAGVSGLFVLVAIALTFGTGILVVHAWRERSGPMSAAAVSVSVLAALSILWVAAAINLRG